MVALMPSLTVAKLHSCRPNDQMTNETFDANGLGGHEAKLLKLPSSKITHFRFFNFFFFVDGVARNGEKNFGPNCPEIVSRGDHGSAIHPVPPKKGFSDLKVSL